jgi:hypothetical protein
VYYVSRLVDSCRTKKRLVCHLTKKLTHMLGTTLYILPLMFVESPLRASILVAGFVNLLHSGCNALRDEPCKEFLEDHHREEGHCEGEAGPVEEGNSKAPVAHYKSQERTGDVKTSSALCAHGC